MRVSLCACEPAHITALGVKPQSKQGRKHSFVASPITFCQATCDVLAMIMLGADVSLPCCFRLCCHCEEVNGVGIGSHSAALPCTPEGDRSGQKPRSPETQA